jgi:hypothetical protein
VPMVWLRVTMLTVALRDPHPLHQRDAFPKT